MRRLVQGSEAIFHGALRAGATFFAGYPISPSSEILLLAAEHAAHHPEFVFLQSEDEIAAANAVMGASLAGARAFTATSGPGFSLMQEAIGFGHGAEVPAVLVHLQRVGPGTGMPTMPSQQDILQVNYGSHGDYFPIAFYPNSVAECYRYTVAAFNAAEESLSPVVLLGDAFLGHLNEVVDIEAIQVEEVAPRRVPPLGTGKRLFTSLAHDEANRPRTADPAPYRRWFSRVKAGHREVAGRYAAFEMSGNLSSDTLLISFGIVSRVISPLATRYAMFRPIRLLPVLAEELRQHAARFGRIAVIEANDGQYASLVEQALKREVIKVPLLGGRISLAEARQTLSEGLGEEVP